MENKAGFITNLAVGRMLKRSFHGFHGTTYSFLHAYFSTSVASKNATSNPLMVELLVKSVGITEDKAVSIVTDPKVSHLFKSIKNPKLVVDFFKSSGIDETHLRKLIIASPSLLRSNVEKNLKPKIRVLQELGLRGSDLGSVISQHPQLLYRSLKSHIIPTFEMLKSLIGCNEQLIDLLLTTKSQLLLSSNVVKNLPGNVELLRSCGVPSEKLKLFLLRRPVLLLQRTQWLEQLLKRVEEKLGRSRTSAMFLQGIFALSSITEKRLESNLQVCYSYGWSKTQIWDLIRRQPLILLFSGTTLRNKLKYLMEELGYGPDYLLTRHCLLSFSLEKRIAPRHVVIRALKEKQMLDSDLNLYTVMQMSESKFAKLYVLPFKDKFPELYENYSRTTGGAMKSVKI